MLWRIRALPFAQSTLFGHADLTWLLAERGSDLVDLASATGKNEAKVQAALVDVALRMAGTAAAAATAAASAKAAAARVAGSAAEVVSSAAVAAVEVTKDASGVTVRAATTAASATTVAARKAAGATRDAVVSLGRQVGNRERIEALRSEAEILAQFRGLAKWRDLMRAMFAVGVAMAAADGEICESERLAIEEFVGGAAYCALPDGLMAELHAWLAAPPTIEQAFSLASGCGEGAMERFDDVIEVIAHSDDSVHPAEVAFRERWKELRQEHAA